MELNEIKDIAIIAKPFVEPIISTLISPKVAQLKSWLKKQQTNNKVFDNYFENKFEEYLFRTYRNCSNLNILVFPNQQIQIKNIYQPITLNSSKNGGNYKISSFEESFITKYKRILISDNAGMGKSTLMKWISISIIEQSISIPILIELKRINKRHTLLDEIFNQINPIDKSFDKNLILKFLELGSFTILFDGFDEIEYNERQTVIQDIKSLTSKAPENWYILTSRPDSELTSFGDFQLFNINPLSKKESFELIDKYDSVNNNHLSEKLKEGIEIKFSQVKEFLTNPFLVSLLYKTYTYNKDIPSKKSTFYDEVYSALYKHHDLSKDGYKRNKKSGLDIHDFRLVLRRLAFNTSKVAKTEYTDIQLIAYLKEVNQSINLEFKELSYSEDLELNVPLFVRDGQNLKWSHKSVQDYFTAEYICSHPKKKEIVQKIYESQKSNYLQIIDFISELEPQIFSETILLPLLKKFIYYSDNSYKSCKISTKEIRRRQSITFGILFGMQQNVDNISDWVKKFHDDSERKIGEFTLNNINISTAEKKPIMSLIAISFDQEIINIIGNKGSKYTKKIERNDKQKELNIKLPSKEILFIDDKPDCLFNNPKIFNAVSNKIISSRIETSSSNNSYLLDYEKSKTEIKEIERQIKIEKEKDILEGI
ncbi:NACHT domain-containing protein [Polaribacter sp. MSW13]|uniref:NACHT domain-containing protein n=1 Tax=Polaribacter marinus TaxID=2916838 RepID=A0A9X1VRE1_9FLAO|nr:NACHT domain-containing protein [Polaribacter marinus]MCI2230483.1 NACHT domain-containing protein [Polaribacter marinus]